MSHCFAFSMRYILPDAFTHVQQLRTAAVSIETQPKLLQTVVDYTHVGSGLPRKFGPLGVPNTIARRSRTNGRNRNQCTNTLSKVKVIPGRLNVRMLHIYVDLMFWLNSRAHHRPSVAMLVLSICLHCSQPPYELSQAQI